MTSNKVTPGNIRRVIVEEAIGLVNIPRDGGELKNPWTNQRGWMCIDRQREGNTSVQGIRIHNNGLLWGSLCQCHPDDEGKDGDAVDGNGQAIKRDHDRSQSTRRGEHNCDDYCRVESRLSFNFERKFHARSVRRRGKLRQKL